MTDRLLQPMRFANGTVAPNRVWVAPMTNKQSHEDGRLSDAELTWLERRALGGFGVIESCATHVTESGQGWPGQWGLYSDLHTPGWRRAAERMKSHGSMLFAQLFHGGERAHRAQGRAIVSCVSSGTPGRDDEVHQLTPAQIEALIEAFADAACRAADAGLDGVELHGAHGYLLCQFLRADLNTRTDGWGGDLPGRARLLRRVMQTIRQRVPASFVVGVRLSAENGTFLTGLDLDESLQTAQWLCDDGADFIHVSLWDAHLNCSKRPDVHPARVFRDALPEAVPVITAGQIWTRAHAHQQLDHGADAVALGRAAITTPNWPQQVGRDGKEPLMPPVSAQQLRDRDLSETFVTYMKRWPGFVHTDDGGRPAK